MRSQSAFRDAVLVGLTRALVSAACWWSGFRAISDDDYSRVVIAARFAAAPSLDPSGTSWLPLPFWLYGLPMWLFGDSLTTARAVALVLGIGSALLVWLAARTLGLAPLSALVAGLAGALLPYGAWLSVATVPEAPSAALVLFGVVCLARSESNVRRWGGLALGAACLCRYEAWAPAAVFGLWCGVQAVRQRRRELWGAAALALLPIGLWLLHGLVRHGDALFFVARVTQYRAALGRESAGWLGALVQVPWAVVRFEPELFALVSTALGLSLGRGRWPLTRDALGPALALLGLLLFLISAEARGGAATHHPERSLLPIFWFLALLAVGLMTELAREPARAWRLPAVALPLTLAASLLLRPDIRGSFVNRTEEEALGGLLRGLKTEHIALDTDDFGFFALQAALGHGKSWPLSNLDPRRPEPRPDSRAKLARRLREGGALYLVTTRQRYGLAQPLGVLRASTTHFVLLELLPAALASPD